jgi:hypothetical protein
MPGRGEAKMSNDNQSKKTLIEKIEDLPPEAVDEVAQFVDFLVYRDEDRHLVQAAVKLSEPSLTQAWDNPDDADYDKF